MPTPTEQEKETNRLEELKSYNILDTLTEKEYEEITALASIVCEVPIALISFVDKDRQWFKSHRGLDVTETLREYSFCAHAIQSPEEALIVKDSRQDDRFKDNPYVIGEPNIVFYAGIPLINEEGFGLGTVCIIDNKPRVLSDHQLKALKILSEQVMSLLQMRKTNEDLGRTKRQLEHRNQQLGRATQRLELALHAGKLGFWELDMATGEFTCSGKFLEIMDMPDKAPIRRSDITDIVHPEDLAIREAAFTEALKTGSLEYKGRIVRKDNSIRWIQSSGEVDYDKNGKAKTIIGTIRDITEEKQQQEFIRENEQKFRLLADSLPQLIWVSGENGDINYFNRSLYTYLGIDQHEISKELLVQFIHPEDKREFIARFTRALATGDDFNFEHRLLKENTEYHWVDTRCIAHKDPGGKTQMWVCSATDIHEQKMFTAELEKKVADRTREIAAQNTDLDKMNKELQAFTYISSHDLQEPLRKIQVYSSLLNERELEQLSPNGREYLKKIDNASVRMRKLISDLIAYSRTTATEKVFEKIPLKDFIEELKADLHEEIEKKNASVLLSGDCLLSVIGFQFRQLVYNLASNSLKFSRAGADPVINFSCELLPAGSGKYASLDPALGYFHISVSDNGIGFDELYKEKIFGLFQRLHTKELQMGTGIGLAIVKKIVENHDGFISASSVENEGTTFDIFLPAP